MARTSLTSSSKASFDNSPAKVCMKIFHRGHISVPTSFVVLPFELQWDSDTQRLVVPTKDYIELSQQIGKCLLLINKITARLAFWLVVKEHLTNGVFREKLKEWIRRARTEDTKAVATEFVKEMHCGMAYVNICREILEKENIHSNAKAYIDDPIRAARDEMKRCTKTIMRCYASGNYFFYLLDEHRWTPVATGVAYFGTPYPLYVEGKSSLLADVFLPFMNISVMSATAVDGLAGLARLLGLPPSEGIPACWTNTKLGLIHRGNSPSSVMKFATLQRQIRGTTIFVSEGARRLSQCNQTPHNLPSELKLLERFYEEHDQTAVYSDLRRVSDFKGSKLWISDVVLNNFLDKAELVCVENRLQRLSLGVNKMDEMEEAKETEMSVGKIQAYFDSTLSLCTAQTDSSLSLSTNDTISFDTKGEITRKRLKKKCKESIVSCLIFKCCSKVT